MPVMGAGKVVEEDSLGSAGGKVAGAVVESHRL